MALHRGILDLSRSLLFRLEPTSQWDVGTVLYKLERSDCVFHLLLATILEGLTPQVRKFLMVPVSVKDSYRILGISQGASPDEIKNAYRTTVVIHQE